MSRRKHNKAGRGSIALSSFIALERYILNSPAWRHLSAMARAAYLEIAAGYDGRNNGRIIFGSKTLGDRLGTGKATAARALTELESHGFLVCAKKGGFVCKVRHASEWRLTAFKCDVTGALPLKPFMHWKPQIQKSVSPARPYGIASETEELEISPNEAPRYHQQDREGHFDGVHGITSETLLYSSHRGGNRLADANREIEIQTVGCAALKSLNQLDAGLPDHLKSWVQPPIHKNLASAA